MHLDEFSEGHSFFHKMDPRVKFIVFIPLVFVIALSKNITAGAISLLLAVIFIFIAKTSLKALLKRLVVVNFFILFLWFTLPFSIQGKALFYLGKYIFSFEGAIYVLSISLKANAIFLFTISILGTTEVFSLAHALLHLKFPKKLIELFFFFYRYISVLHKEYQRLFQAAKVRAFNPRTNLRTYRTYAYLLGMLFLRSYERSQRVYQALILRGFKGEFPLISHFQLRKQDLVFAVFMYGIGIFILI
ncbi:MAG: cobalt ECF transporter T component CbiQ [Candidatus Saelkia tenebricola]|nr:cobalt ECF transporter T component CbiQ [Candidatus Saelkia tenebricola]